MIEVIVHKAAVQVDWLNDEGVWETRIIVPESLELRNYGGSPEVQWHLSAWDCVRMARRTFKLVRLSNFRSLGA